MQFWDTGHSRKENWTVQGHSEPVSSVVVSVNGKRFASASYDRSIRVLDVESRQAVARF